MSLTHLFRTGGCALAAAALAACNTLITAPTAFHVFDLGRAPSVATTQGITPSSIEVRAPSWLASSAMQYRLDYLEPASRESFAESRWAGAPADLLQHQLSSALIGQDSVVPGPCRIRVELDEFVQGFDSETDSHAIVAARATLVSSRDDAPLARRAFEVRVAAPMPDARGGVQAHREAVRRLAEELIHWLASLDGPDAQGLNIGERCGN